MANFIYIAKTHPQETVRGSIEAESKQEAINKLIQSGYYPLQIQLGASSLRQGGSWRTSRIPRKETVLFTRQLSNLIQSGINILSSLRIILNQIQNARFKIILGDIANKIRDGNSLSQSLAEYPEIFSKLYISSIAVGEGSGRLSEVLVRLADFLEGDEEFRNSLYSSLAYPAFIVSIGILTIVVLVTFVIPRLVSMFEDMGQVLPWPTKILISISRFFSGYWWSILLGMIASILIMRYALKKEKNQIIIDGMGLKAPIISGIIIKAEISRMFRTLSLLLSSGVPVISALEISTEVVDNRVLKSELQRFKEQIKNGFSLSRCLNESKFFPPFVNSIVKVGEEAGTLETSLLRISNDFEKETDRNLKSFSRLLEPAIILVMGLIVGFIVLSMLLPIFQINLIVK
jgi:type II secretory pathway component PulF